MESQEQDAACAETGRAVGRALFDVVERERDFADCGERGGHIRRLYLFLLERNCKKSRGFAGFFLPHGIGNRSRGLFSRVAIELNFRYVFLHETDISRKLLLFPLLYGTGTCVFWHREAAELNRWPSIQRRRVPPPELYWQVGFFLPRR